MWEIRDGDVRVVLGKYNECLFDCTDHTLDAYESTESWPGDIRHTNQYDVLPHLRPLGYCRRTNLPRLASVVLWHHHSPGIGLSVGCTQYMRV